MSIINNGGRALFRRKGGRADGLKAVGSLVHSIWPEGLPRPNPSVFSDCSQDGVLPPTDMTVTDKLVNAWPSLVKWATSGDSSVQQWAMSK